MIAEIRVTPRPAGTAADRYQHVDSAIAVIQASGLRYEVHGMGNVIEGPPEKMWPLPQAVHQATLEPGSERALRIIKVSSSAQAGGERAGAQVPPLTRPCDGGRGPGARFYNGACAAQQISLHP